MFNINDYRNADGYTIDIASLKSVLTDDNTLTTTIPIRYEYRPDLIAYSLYNDVSYSTFLAVINDIKNSPEGFEKNKTIKYLNPLYKDLI